MQQQEYTLQINQVTGFLIISQQRTRVAHGNPEQLNAFYKKILTHNLLFGWWGIISFFWNIIALYRNAKAKKLLEKLIAEDGSMVN